MDSTRYNSLEAIPDGYREYISDLLEYGIIKGKNDGSLDLSIDMIRCLVLCTRMIDYYILNKEF